jgi:hypothetical protein
MDIRLLKTATARRSISIRFPNVIGHLLRRAPASEPRPCGFSLARTKQKGRLHYTKNGSLTMDWRHNRQSPKSSLEKYPTSGGFLEYQDDVGDDWEDIEESSESYRNERIRPQHAEQRISNSPGGAYTCGRPPLYVSHSSSPPPRPPEATSQAPATPPANPSRLADMTSFLDRAANSNQTKFAATAVLASAVTAGAIFGFQALRRHERVEDLKASIPELGQEHKAEKVCNSGLLRHQNCTG